MSYQEALEAAGATVEHIEYFGSYQGDWLAVVTYKGVRGIIHSWYGSCTGCDAFQAEFGYNYGSCDEHYGDLDPKCRECRRVKTSYDKRLRAMGKRLLDGMLTSAEIEALRLRFVEQGEWDYDANATVRWIETYMPEEA